MIAEVSNSFLFVSLAVSLSFITFVARKTKQKKNVEDPLPPDRPVLESLAADPLVDSFGGGDTNDF